MRLPGDSVLGGHMAGHAAWAGGRMRTRVRVRGLDAACRMVALGAGVAVVTTVATQQWEKRGALVVVALEDPWAERRLVVAVRRLDALPSHARRLTEHLVAAG